MDERQNPDSVKARGQIAGVEHVAIRANASPPQAAGELARLVRDGDLDGS